MLSHLFTILKLNCCIKVFKTAFYCLLSCIDKRQTEIDKSVTIWKIYDFCEPDLQRQSHIFADKY